MLDDIAQAVLARAEVLKYLRGESKDDARERICGYLDELQTKQRYPIYRALQHPLYPILRKIERKHENLHHVVAAARSHRLVYASNHKSHTDYLVEPLVIDDVEPLRSELTAFLDAVRTGTTPPVSAEDGLAAIEMAEAVVASVKEHRWDRGLAGP